MSQAIKVEVTLAKLIANDAVLAAREVIVNEITKAYKKGDGHIARELEKSLQEDRFKLI